METSQPLAIESFSYSWLENYKPPEDGIEEPLRESTYTSYGGTANSPLLEESHNFNFDISITQSPAVLIHADELFSDGLIKPVFLHPSEVESCYTPDSTQNNPCSSISSRIVSPKTVETHHGFLTRWKTSTRGTLRNLSRYVNQICQKVGCTEKSTGVYDIHKKEWPVKSWSSLQQEFPKSITVHSIGALHDHDNSIYEAVLHCIRSIENCRRRKWIASRKGVAAD